MKDSIHGKQGIIPEVQRLIDLEQSRSVLLNLKGSPLRDELLMIIDAELGKDTVISALRGQVSEITLELSKTKEGLEFMTDKLSWSNSQLDKCREILDEGSSCGRYSCPFRKVSVH